MSTDAHGLRVAFYCNLLAWPKRSHGGVRQWVLTMANALVERGVAVDLLCETPRSHFADEPLLDARVNRILLGRRPISRLRLNAYVRAHAGVRIVSALNRYNVAATQLKRRFGEQVHVTLTQREHLSADTEWFSRAKYAWISHNVRRRFNRADAVVAVSRGVAADLRDHFGVSESRLHTIYNPAYRPTYLAAARAPIEHPWLASKTQPVVIAAGRLHHVKGFDFLLRAFARMQTDARLIILGEGKERSRLEQLVNELQLGARVQLPGRVASTAAWFARADVFVLSSRREGLPAVLIEALAVGLPIVATRCPSGPEEVLEGGRWGTLVPVGDVAALAEAMQAAIEHPSHDASALRARAEHFSLDRALEQYLRLWRSPSSAGGAYGSDAD